MHKEGLALNNLQWLIDYKTQPNQTKSYIGWGCRIHRLFVCRGARPLTNEFPVYDTKQSGEVPIMLELWGMRSTPSFPSLPGPLWHGVVAPGRVLSIGQIELNSVIMLNWIVWNGTVFACWTELLEIELFWNLTECKQKVYLFFFFHHTTCGSTCDTLASSAAIQGDNTVSVAQGSTATPGATEQLLPPDRVFITELLEIELFWNLTECKQKVYLY